MRCLPAKASRVTSFGSCQGCMLPSRPQPTCYRTTAPLMRHRSCLIRGQHVGSGIISLMRSLATCNSHGNSGSTHSGRNDSSSGNEEIQYEENTVDQSRERSRADRRTVSLDRLNEDRRCLQSICQRRNQQIAHIFNQGRVNPFLWSTSLLRGLQT